MTTCKNLYLFIVLALVARSAVGLGLGELTLGSFVNEPLEARVELLDVGGLQPEDIRVRLATQEDFDRLGVERAYFLTNMQFEVVFDALGARIHLATDEPLVEPYLDFLIEARWPAGRLLREYTVLVDLPPAVAVVEPLRVEGISLTESSSGTGGPSGRSVAAKPAGRQYDRDAQGMPTAGGKYLVTSNDTLWKIASSAALPGVSVEHTMLATVALNPRAFTGGNINGLKAGYVLALPTEADLSMGISDAISAVKSQNSDWQAGITSQPVLRVVADNDLDDATPPELSGDPMSGQENAAAASSAALDNAMDEISEGLSAEDSESESSQVTESATSSVPSVNSDMVAGGEVGQASLAMAEERLADLSGQVGNLRELVTIKDRQIAELQASLTAQQQAVPAADQPNGFNWLVSLVVRVVLGALALLLGLRLRQRRQVADPSDSDESIEPPLTSIPDVYAPVSEPVSEDDSAPALDGAISEALAEAEIYISYGRHQQALNILLAAADKSTGPAAAEAYCKMIEIALENDRRDEALNWLDNVKAQGSDEQIARASTAVTDSQEVDLPDLGDLVETEVFSTTDQPTSAEQPAGAAKDGDIEVAGEPPVNVDTAGGTAIEPAASQSEESESLALEPEWQVDSRSEMDDSLELDAIETDPIASENNQESKLPPELAEVLGTDEAPPLVTPSESESEGLVYATEADPMDAKLDLARAYIDMGDEEGARPILEDVVTNGDLRQQAEARELLIHID